MSYKITTLEYKGYLGGVYVSRSKGTVYGWILHVDEFVTYESESVAGIEQQFQNAVDRYIFDRQKEGRWFEPNHSVRQNVSLDYCPIGWTAYADMDVGGCHEGVMTGEIKNGRPVGKWIIDFGD